MGLSYQKIKKTLDTANAVLDTANNIVEKGNTVKATYGVLKHAKDVNGYNKSLEAKRYWIELEKAKERTRRVIILNLLIWIILIIGTIVLCVTGNDVVLRILGL